MGKEEERKSNKAIRYRLYPDAKQREMFARTFGCCRKVWNLMLSDKKVSYDKTGSFGSQTPAMYKKEYPYLKEVDSLALANVQLNLQQAMRNRFDKTRKKRNGFPQFKSAKRSKKSYTTNNQNGTVAISDKAIRLPKIGWVKAVIHRIPDDTWVLKSATISQDSDGKYYASVLFEYSVMVSEATISDNVIGLDYKSDGLYIDSNGHNCSMPHFYRDEAKKLTKAQRCLSRMKGSRKGEIKSRNYLKQLTKVNRIHRHISNQRKDFLHKESTKIANSVDIVCVEDLNMKAMSNKGFGNGKATLDNGYGMFLNMLEYKLADRGKRLVKVDKWFASSQICSCCGTIHPEMKNLTARTMICSCGAVLNRDYNAAINIKKEGLRLLETVA